MTTGDGIAVAAKVAGVCFIAWLVGPVMVAGLLKLLLCCAVILFSYFKSSFFVSHETPWRGEA